MIFGLGVVLLALCFIVALFLTCTIKAPRGSDIGMVIIAVGGLTFILLLPFR